jgi:hypothetical protein
MRNVLNKKKQKKRLLLFQLVDVQRFALVMVVEVMAGQPAVGRYAAGVSVVFVPTSYVLW